MRRVNDEAFGGPAEARIVDALRGTAAVSLVAERAGEIVGHIFFHSAGIALALGPMAVLPAHQTRGIGTALVREGIRLCREQGHDVVVVVGHPEFYPRFGFQPARAMGLETKYPVPDDVFMALELKEGAGVRGMVEYPAEFDRAT